MKQKYYAAMFLLLTMSMFCFSGCEHSLRGELQKVFGIQIFNDTKVEMPETTKSDTSAFVSIGTDMTDYGFGEGESPVLRAKVLSVRCLDSIADSRLPVQGFDLDNIPADFLTPDRDLKNGYSLMLVTAEVEKIREQQNLSPEDKISRQLYADFFHLQELENGIPHRVGTICYFDLTETEQITRSSDEKGYYAFSVPEGMTASCTVGWVVPTTLCQDEGLLVSFGTVLKNQQYTYLNKK